MNEINKENKIEDDVLERLPKWCKIILRLKKEIEEKPKDI